MAKYNYRKINFTAQKILVENCHVRFPINILHLISQFPNIQLMTYQEFNNDPENPGFSAYKISTDAFTMELGDDDYLIVYNSDTGELIPQRIRFSLAHELGHIKLNHFDHKETLLARGHFGLNKRQYTFLEKEADLFADQLLAPPYLISDTYSYDEIANIFDVSKKTAEIVSKVHTNYPWKTCEPEFIKFFANPEWISRKDFYDNNTREYNGQFEFQIGGKYYYFCEQCHHLEISWSNSLHFCTQCGSDNLLKINEFQYFEFHETKEQEVSNMNIQKLEVDAEGRLTGSCPKCGNDHLQNNYCTVCGAFIINKCSGWRKDSNGEYYQDKPCDGPLKGGDRYCSKCGAASTFLNNGFLKPWDSTEDQKLDEDDIDFITTTNNPFDIDSSELPF